MKKIILIWVMLIATLITSCQKDQAITKNYLVTEQTPLKPKFICNEIPRISESDGTSLEVNFVFDSTQLNLSQLRTPINGNPNWSRAMMEDKPVDNEFDMNDAVLDFEYKTLSRSVPGMGGPGNSVPLKTKLKAVLQAVGAGAQSPEIGFGVMIKTFNDTSTIMNPDTLIEKVTINGVPALFAVKNGIIRVIGYGYGYKIGFWNTPKWLNPNKNFNLQPTLNGVNLKPYAGNPNVINTSYSHPTVSDSVEIEITYKRESMNNLYKNKGTVVIYHADPFFTAPNFTYFKRGIPYCIITPTNTAWSTEFIDIRYTYPNLHPTYKNFTNRVDSLAYLK